MKAYRIGGKDGKGIYYAAENSKDALKYRTEVAKELGLSFLEMHVKQDKTIDAKDLSSGRITEENLRMRGTQ